MKRRTLLQGAAACAAGAFGIGSQTMAASPDGSVRIGEPFHGAVLNRRHGEAVDGGLSILVRGEAPVGWRVTVDGVAAERNGAKFQGRAVLRRKDNEIVVRAEGPGSRESDGQAEAKVCVRWDRHSFPRYRFAIDDNSFFLRDVHARKPKSLFECFYLGMLRELHRKYGAKFVLNVYFRTEDGFELPQFSDRYKPEWRDNAHWLRLAFHAWADKPDRPYQDAPPEKLAADFDRIAAEIRRFAGEEAYSPTTVVHWGMVRPEAYGVLAQRGVRVLSGYFDNAGGKFDVNYRVDDRRSEWLSRHDALVDFPSGLVFSRIDLVCNLVPLDQIEPRLKKVVGDPNTAEIVDFLTHEQYFWPFYVNYLPDHPQRLDRAIRFVTERGYKPVFLHEGLLGAPE